MNMEPQINSNLNFRQLDDLRMQIENDTDSFHELNRLNVIASELEPSEMEVQYENVLVNVARNRSPIQSNSIQLEGESVQVESQQNQLPRVSNGEGVDHLEEIESAHRSGGSSQHGSQVIFKEHETESFENKKDCHCSCCSNRKKNIQDNQKNNEEEITEKKLAFSDSDDGSCCPICLENWTNIGDHRVSALKCGHLFGLSCIKRCINDSSRSCPVCKKKAIVRDIRYIYATKLLAMDATELDNLKQELDKVNEQKNMLANELSCSIMKNQKMTQQVENLKGQISRLTRILETQKQNFISQENVEEGGHEKVRVYMDKQLEINKDGGCRVLDCQNSSDLLVVSTKSNNPLFGGFGVKKITISSYRTTAFIPLHSLTIRDISFQPQSHNFLTVSLDKSIKLVDGSCNSVVLSTIASSPLWSCCWDTEGSSYFYVGEQQGSTVQYDIRNTSQSINTYIQATDMSPVVSLSCIPPNYMPLMQGGLMCCKLNGLYVFAKRENEYEAHWLPYKGPFMCMRMDSESQRFLVSSRPNTLHPYSRHSLLSLDKDKNTDKLVGNTMHCFNGGSLHKMLSRSAIVTGKQGKYVAAYETSHRAVLLWSINSGYQVCSIPAHESVLDLSSFEYNKENILVSLTEKKVEFFKFC